MQLSGKGSVLLRHVFEHLSLIDRQYFGLRFVDGYSDSDPVRRQLLAARAITLSWSQTGSKLVADLIARC